ncbi:MAG: hypothetical protein J4G05_02725 [Chlorobi bacterium]|nr:hypothetical protein [Chlorobiota bacterium]
MDYTYKYPGNVSEVIGRRFGHITVPDEFLAQTHEELMKRLGAPNKTIAVQIEVNASKEHIWEIAAGSVDVFFSHQPVYAGISPINSLGSEEGGRYIIHRIIDGCVIDRVGEVMLSMPLSQFTVSDIDSADVSVSGFFLSLYSINLEDHPDNPDSTLVLLSYTMLGVAHPWALGMLAYQAKSIKHYAESGGDDIER